MKCSQGCSTGCADSFLPFYDKCSGTDAYNALMPLGGGGLPDFDGLALRCREPSVTAARHYAAIRSASAGLSPLDVAKVHAIEHRVQELENGAKAGHVHAVGSQGTGSNRGVEVGELKAQMAAVLTWKSQQEQLTTRYVPQ